MRCLKPYHYSYLSCCIAKESNLFYCSISLEGGHCLRTPFLCLERIIPILGFVWEGAGTCHRRVGDVTCWRSCFRLVFSAFRVDKVVHTQDSYPPVPSLSSTMSTPTISIPPIAPPIPSMTAVAGNHDLTPSSDQVRLFTLARTLANLPLSTPLVPETGTFDRLLFCTLYVQSWSYFMSKNDPLNDNIVLLMRRSSPWPSSFSGSGTYL